MSLKFSQLFRGSKESRKPDRIPGRSAEDTRRKIHELEQLRSENEKRKAQNILNIHLQRDKMVAAINELSAKLEARCTRDFVQRSRAMIEMKIELERDLREIKVENTFSSYSVARSEKEQDLSQRPPYDLKLWKDKIKFVEGKIKNSELESMFGSVVEEKKSVSSIHRQKSEKNDRSDAYDVLITKLSSFKLGDDAIVSISPCLHGMAWLNCLESDVNKLLNTAGDIVDIRNVGRRSLDLVTLQNGYHIFTDSTYIYMSSSSCTVEVLVDTAPLYPCGINRTADGNLLVTLVDETSFNLSESSIRIIRIVSMLGMVVQTYSGYSKGEEQPLFTLPLRAIQNVNLDICVVDRIADSKGRVCILGQDGGLKSVYSGNHFTKEFDPGDITCDTDGNLIVTDDSNNVVHLLNADAHFVKFLLTDDEGISKPCSLALFKDTLWIGGWQGTVHVFRYETRFMQNQREAEKKKGGEKWSVKKR